MHGPFIINGFFINALVSVVIERLKLSPFRTSASVACQLLSTELYRCSFMSTSKLLLALALLAAALPADCQRRRPPRSDSGQNPRTVEESIKAAEEKEREREATLRTGWNDAQNHHFRNQDKATRKRMRQNDRRRKRMRLGRQMPWWRRIFGRQNRYR